MGVTMTRPEDDVRMLTERVSSRYVDLDSWPIKDMLAAIYEGQLAAVAAVRPALSAIAAAVADAVRVLGQNGRLLFLMAGGFDALVHSVEGAEDSEADGARAIAAANIGGNDVVIGVAASGTTPYTIGALRTAREAGAVTIAIASNPGAPLLAVAKHPVLVKTGAEAIT